MSKLIVYGNCQGEAQFAYTDNLLGRLREQTPDAQERFRRYRDLDIDDPPDLARYAEYEEVRLLREDARLGLGLGRFILENYQTTCLFHAITHPTRALLVEMTREIAAGLGIEVVPFDDYYRRYIRLYG
jgi:hypothetical protein